MAVIVYQEQLAFCNWLSATFVKIYILGGQMLLGFLEPGIFGPGLEPLSLSSLLLLWQYSLNNSVLLAFYEKSIKIHLNSLNQPSLFTWIHSLLSMDPSPWPLRPHSPPSSPPPSPPPPPSSPPRPSSPRPSSPPSPLLQQQPPS